MAAASDLTTARYPSAARCFSRSISRSTSTSACSPSDSPSAAARACSRRSSIRSPLIGAVSGPGGVRLTNVQDRWTALKEREDALAQDLGLLLGEEVPGPGNALERHFVGVFAPRVVGAARDRILAADDPERGHAQALLLE